MKEIGSHELWLSWFWDKEWELEVSQAWQFQRGRGLGGRESQSSHSPGHLLRICPQQSLWWQGMVPGVTCQRIWRPKQLRTINRASSILPGEVLHGEVLVKVESRLDGLQHPSSYHFRGPGSGSAGSGLSGRGRSVACGGRGLGFYRPKHKADFRLPWPADAPRLRISDPGTLWGR